MKPKHLLLALLLPFALIAAACSDDDSGDDSDSDSTEEPESSDEGTDDEGSEDVGSEDDGSDSEESDSEESGTGTTEGELAAADEDDETNVSPGNNMGSAITGDTAEHNIAEIAAGTADVSTLTRLVITAGLLPTVRDGGPFTVLAPTNEAFRAVPAETMAALREDRAQQADLLTLHVFPEALTTEDLEKADGTSIETVQGGKLLVEVTDDGITVGGATIIIPDIEASNGVVHAIDSVITEPNG